MYNMLVSSGVVVIAVSSACRWSYQ